jgi:hypothetical protein
MNPSSRNPFAHPCLLDGSGVGTTGPLAGTDFFGVDAEFEDACVKDRREGESGGEEKGGSSSTKDQQGLKGGNRKNSSHTSTHTFKRGDLVNIAIAIRHRTQPHPSSLQKLQQLQGARKE